jgi:aminoglycoside phosphotransferase (APT) family kinase protein
VHGDLWAGNILVVGSRFFIVDWDDLAVGDPLKDYVDLTQGAHVEVPGEGNAAAAERLALWRRARLLLELVDPLADWSEAGSVLADPTSVRAAKRSAHEAAKRTYLEIYGK